LRGAGAALALPALDMMAANAPAAAPTRFLSVFQPNGVYPSDWDVDNPGKGFTLSPILKPLEAFRGDMSIISGLDNIGNTGHVQLTGGFLTAHSIADGRNAESVDQMIARRIGQDTMLRSIVLGTEPPRQGNDLRSPIALANTVSWASPTMRLSPTINPRVAFDYMFRTRISKDARQELRERRSVVDIVMADARDLQRQAGRRDRQKIDEYLAGVREVEARIERTLDPPPRDWTPPTSPKLIPPPPGIPRRKDEHLKLMMDLMVLAFWTDTTRVGSLMTAHGFSRQSFGYLEDITSDHHSMSHHKNDPRQVKQYTRICTWYTNQVAYLLEKMRGIDEGDGSLLDHSLVLYGSGMKDGNGHIREDLPILLFGKGSGRFKQGRHLACKPHTPLANLHLSLLHKFGVEADSFNGGSTGTIDV
jgi:hypothetical protein